MKDLFEKCVNPPLFELGRKANIYPYFHELESRQDVEVIMEGKRRIMLGSNNYLGLTVNERVVNAAKKALDELGTGCSGSRFLNGTLKLHVQLERELSEFVNKEAAMTFSTGFQSNLGIISAIIGRHDYMICDKENHASIYDGCKLSYGKMLRFDHNDMEDLEAKLKSIPADAACLIITDGVFSMSGDIAKLPEIVALKKKYGARLMVDDAHGLGVIGKGGRGTASHFDLDDEVDIIMGTFSKSLASLGGYVAGSSALIDYVKHVSRPFIFSASIPPSCAAAALEALRVIKENPQLPARLLELADYMRKGLKARNVELKDAPTPIIPIYTYSMIRTLAVNKALYENGVFVNCVLPPATPENECLLRVSLMASHTEALIDEAMDIIAKTLAEVPMDIDKEYAWLLNQQ